jgi:hypothetical protein
MHNLTFLHHFGKIESDMTFTFDRNIHTGHSWKQWRSSVQAAKQAGKRIVISHAIVGDEPLGYGH